MNIIVMIYKKLKIKWFNKYNKTIIKSLYANLNAKYGKKVRIDEGTYISEDVSIGDQSYVKQSRRSPSSRLRNAHNKRTESIRDDEVGP